MFSSPEGQEPAVLPSAHRTAQARWVMEAKPQKGAGDSRPPVALPRLREAEHRMPGRSAESLGGTENLGFLPVPGDLDVMDQRRGLVHLAAAWAVLAEKGLPSISLTRRGRKRGFRQTFGETCGSPHRSPGTGRQPSVAPKNDRWDKAATRMTWYLQENGFSGIRCRTLTP